MLKKSITYTNLFTDEEVTEDHYFHISKADMVEMEMAEHKTTHLGKDGKKYSGAQAKLMRIVDAEDGTGIITEIKDFIRRSYGKRDGDRFIKNAEIWEEFASTEAYSQLLWTLTTDAASAGEFINGVFPKELEKLAAEVRAQVEQDAANGGALSTPTGATDDRQAEIEAATPENPVILTRGEIAGVDREKLQSGVIDGRYKLS